MVGTGRMHLSGPCCLTFGCVASRGKLTCQLREVAELELL